MPSVLFDYTRVVSALGQSAGKPHLHLSNLAKLVEAIILFDSIYTTEHIMLDFLETGSVGSQDNPGPFDFAKTYIYEPVFAGIFKEVPFEVDKAAAERKELPRRRYRGLSFAQADLAILDEAVAAVSKEEFQFLWEKEFSEEYLLSTLERIRDLTTTAGELGVPYDPIPFRIPLLKLSMPGNLKEEHLAPYRQFERGVQGYLEEVLHDRLGFELPLMLAIVLRECRPGSPDDVFAIALQLRNDAMFLRFRVILDEHIAAYRNLDIATLTKMDRIVKNELARLKSQLSSELPSEFKLTLKPGWFPVGMGWEIKSTLQRFRDRKQLIPLANLATLTRETLRGLGNVRRNVESVLPLEFQQ